MAATTNTPRFSSKPSSQLAIGLKFAHAHHGRHQGLRLCVFCRSISSIKQCRMFLLLEHISDSDAPTPTNISTKSEPEIVKNGTFASPATARASNVLPVQGGQPSKYLLVFSANNKFCRSLKKSTNSLTSSFASSPPTSLKFVLTWPPSRSYLFLPNVIGPPLPPTPPHLSHEKEEYP